MPVVGLFVDSTVLWGDAWQRKAVGHVHKLVTVTMNAVFTKLAEEIEIMTLENAIGHVQTLLEFFKWFRPPHDSTLMLLNKLLAVATTIKRYARQ